MYLVLYQHFSNVTDKCIHAYAWHHLNHPYQVYTLYENKNTYIMLIAYYYFNFLMSGLNDKLERLSTLWTNVVNDILYK